jgi:hypothetical protein
MSFTIMRRIPNIKGAAAGGNKNECKFHGTNKANGRNGAVHRSYPCIAAHRHFRKKSAPFPFRLSSFQLLWEPLFYGMKAGTYFGGIFAFLFS